MKLETLGTYTQVIFVRIFRRIGCVMLQFSIKKMWLNCFANPLTLCAFLCAFFGLVPVQFHDSRTYLGSVKLRFNDNNNIFGSSFRFGSVPFPHHVHNAHHILPTQDVGMVRISKRKNTPSPIAQAVHAPTSASLLHALTGACDTRTATETTRKLTCF